MKNVASALALVLTLTAAAAYTPQRSTPSVQEAKSSAFPIPSCPLNDPNACGMGGPNPNLTSKR